MSASKEWTDWHLTPKGWVRGDEKIDVAGIKKAPLPQDRVRTERYKVERSHIHAPEERSLSLIWSGDDSEEIERLIRIYGHCPEDL